MQSVHDELFLIVKRVLELAPENSLPVPLRESLRTPTLAALKSVGDAFLSGRHLDVAEFLFRALEDRATNHTWIAIGLARLATAREDWDTAACAWRNCVNGFPNRVSPGWLNNLARAERKRGHEAAAETVLRQCRQRFPNFTAAAPALANLLQATGRHAEAIDTWEEALRDFSDHAEPGWLIGIAMSLRSLGRLDDAERQMNAMVERFPTSIPGMTRRAVAAERAQDWPAALQRWTACLEAYPHHPRPDWLVGRSTALFRLGEIESAMAGWRETIRRFPDFQPARLRMAGAAREIRRWSVVRQCLTEQIRRFPDLVTADLLGAEAKAILLDGDYVGAAAAIAALDARFPESPLACRMRIELMIMANAGIDALSPCVEEALARFPDDRQILAEYSRVLLGSGRPVDAEMVAQVLERSGNDSYALVARWRVEIDRDGEAALRDTITATINEREWTLQMAIPVANFLLSLWSGWPAPLARRLMEVIVARYPGRIMAVMVLARARIALRDDEGALELIDALPDGCEVLEAMELQAWAAARRGALESSKTLWRQILEKYPFPAVNSPTPALNLVKADQTAKGGVTAFLNVKNEMLHLPEFLRHHRALGVRRFVVVDNSSSDDGPAYLAAQPDVVLYRTGDSFQAAGAGLRWINVLRDRHAAGEWSLYLDADEALIYPGYERVKLDGVTAWLDGEGAEAMGAFMLDLYPARLRNENGEPAPQSAYVFYDADYEWLGQVRAPYIQPVGGVRARLFGSGEYLHKTPLLKQGAGIYVGSHNTTPVRVSGIFGTLLHYKLLNIAARFQPARPGIDGNPFMAGRPPELMRRHVRYAARLPALTKADLRRPGLTRELTDSLTLTAEGVMRAPDAYLAWAGRDAGAE